ncbi:hypothetical protein [Umezawaea tangerina]|uniref:Membrane protein (TIGR02234 family) n=1 Tax=Umezawaea tangerina TaxID=84725 RepID=A0A2T0SJW8_9PSEU|nr:hypothetical protein [Umezawaea tangerina]PRY33707.1 hypothetical protein CLV43_11914 [Umezawaea tangerina]
MSRVVGAAGLLGGAALVVAASSRPLFEQVRVDSGHRTGYRMSLWGSEYTSPDGIVAAGMDPVRFGVPVVVAAVLLVVAAVLVLAESRLPARAAAAARVGAVAAAALLLGSVWTIGQLVVVMARRDDITTGSVDSSGGSAMWLLVAACGAALVGALLVQRRPRRAVEPEGAVVYQLPDDTAADTPPMGVGIHPEVSTEESSPT